MLIHRHRPPTHRLNRALLVLALGCAAAAVVVVVDPPALASGLNGGPAYVQAPGSPFTVGGDLTWLAFDQSAGVLAASDYEGGALAVLSLNPTSGAVAPVTGSPFATGHGTDSVAISPSGGLLAATNLVDDAVSVLSVGSGGGLTAVAGSPFSTGAAPRAVTFSPSGDFLAVANETDDTVSVFSVGSGGALTAVAGSPFSTGSEPVAASFNPSGSLLAVANEGANTVSLFTVDASTDAVTPSAGSPLAVADGPSALAFNPAGTLLAVADASSSTISVFTTGAAAVGFSPVTGSPFATGQDPLSIAFNQTGSLLATADFLDDTVAVFDVSAGGAPNLVQGAPFATGAGPHSVLFVPNSALIAVADATDGTVSVLEPTPPPTITITTPAPGQSYPQGSRVQTSFACLDNSTTGIAYCQDGSGMTSPGLLDTRTLGPHTYTVDAASGDGLTATASVTYLVTPVAPRNVVLPQLAGSSEVGRVLRCSPGRWLASTRSRYSYQWERGGLALAGAHRRTYRITELDRGSAITCVVIADDGSQAQAKSRGVVVPLDATEACPGPTGTLSESGVGPFKLGESRASAALGRTVRHSAPHTLELCLSPADVELGFPDVALRRALEGNIDAGRAVWALTSNPGYTYDGVGAGIALDTAEQRLGAGIVEHRGRTTFYLARKRTATVIVTARAGVVEQIGVAANRATATAEAVAALVHALPA